MTLEDKNKWVAYFRCTHSNWLINFNNLLSYDAYNIKLMQKNITIVNLINTFNSYDTETEDNCLTLEDLCTIKNKIIKLLGDCSTCN